MIIPRNDKEREQLEKIIDRNRKAGDWIVENLSLSGLPGNPIPNDAELFTKDVLDKVGDKRLKK